MSHSPTPWQAYMKTVICDNNRQFVLRIDHGLGELLTEANRDLILDAVNGQKELVEDVATARTQRDDCIDWLETIKAQRDELVAAYEELLSAPPEKKNRDRVLEVLHKIKGIPHEA